MLKYIFKLFDNALFTIVFIVGIQLPAFINAYSQRLSGHLNEAEVYLSKFQSIADLQYQGNLEQLVSAFKSNSDDAIQKMSSVILENIESVNSYQQQIIHLESTDYLHRLYYFMIQVDIEKASATFSQFVPAIPLEVNAIITGIVFSLFFSALIHLLCKVSKYIVFNLSSA